MLEFATIPDCENSLDLDCNDSSGATGSDYNSSEYNCLSDGVDVADDDIRLLYDAIITEMTIEVAGFVPDAPSEIIDITGFIPNIDVTGAGTPMMTLANAGGATSRDFKDALRLVQYYNTALDPTPGLRTVEVQFTTEAGTSSNIATAFIQVTELPLIEVDLGPDPEACEGSTATLDAGNTGAMYLWSTGETTQTITVADAGQYIVTVSNGVDCPNQDTIDVELIPVITISFDGDYEICDNQQAELTIQTNATFPLSVDVAVTPGGIYSFSNVTGNFIFTDNPGQNTQYQIISVVPSQPACIDLVDPNHFVEVHPTYNHSAEASICEGDSIFLGYYWETVAGVYEIFYDTPFDCDSIVNYTITVLPSVMLSDSALTCDPSQAGVFITHLDNPDGCDTVVTTTVSLLSSDTTHIAQITCSSAQTGIFIDTLSNMAGCDSLVITTISLIPPVDTTLVMLTSCDSADLGIIYEIFAGVTGCDSLVATIVTLAGVDTTLLTGTSCDSASIGVFQQLLSGQDGCDSLVITTITGGSSDTTRLFTTSCDSASLGVTEEIFISHNGCDSLVITTVTYSASDSTFIEGTTCDPPAAGIFVQNLVNRFGCDSIVTSTVILLPSDSIFISSSTCDPASAGIFIQNLVNQSGCDSVVTETVTLLPSDETFLFSTTCVPSEAGMFITAHINQHGCDSTVTLAVTLTGGDTTWQYLQTCDPAMTGVVETIYTNVQGCDSVVITGTTLFPLPDVSVISTSDHNGYDISCAGESDGSAAALVSGAGPFTYLWSTGEEEQGISGLSSGNYAVTIWDGNGCTASGSITLIEPDPFSIMLMITAPDCFDQNSGVITVLQTGGVEPLRYSIDGVNYQSSPEFKNLGGGSYEVTALDANACEKKEIIWINVSMMVNVELGDNQTISAGDTAIIQALVNVPFDSLASVSWTGLQNPDSPTCLTQPVAPVITTTYSVTVTTKDGCADEDAMTLVVDQESDIYIPNVFSPNGDNINDRLLISVGDGVKEIKSFTVYDRWGELVFNQNNFSPNDPGNGWDGKLKGEDLNPGVFVYLMIFEMENGESDVRYGSVTVVR